MEITPDLLKDELIPALDAQIIRFRAIQRVLEPREAGKEALFPIPAITMEEHKKLAAYEQTDWAGVIVRTMSQSMEGVGFVGPNGTNSADWTLWNRCRLGQKENYIYDASFSYGESYLKAVKKGPEEVDAIFRSPFNTTVFFDDALNDEYPSGALERDGSDYFVYTDTEIIKFTDGEGGLEEVERSLHGFENVPFVRFVDTITSEAKTYGEVEKVIPLITKIEKKQFSASQNIHSNAFQLLTATGLKAPDDAIVPHGATPEEAAEIIERAAAKEKLEIQVGGVLIGDAGTSFGVIPSADPGAFIPAIEGDVRQLAAVTQTPSNFFTSEMAGMSAEQAGNANRTWRLKLRDRQSRFSAAFEAFFRLLRQVTQPGAEVDYSTKFVWKEVDSVSMAAEVDALVKVSSLEVPKTELWDLIPNTTPELIDRWRREHARLKGIEDAYRIALTDGAATSGDYSPEEIDQMNSELLAAA